jgi:hypothetical protein
VRPTSCERVIGFFNAMSAVDQRRISVHGIVFLIFSIQSPEWARLDQSSQGFEISMLCSRSGGPPGRHRSSQQRCLLERSIAVVPLAQTTKPAAWLATGPVVSRASRGRCAEQCLNQSATSLRCSASHRHSHASGAHAARSDRLAPQLLARRNSALKTSLHALADFFSFNFGQRRHHRQENVANQLVICG